MVRESLIMKVTSDQTIEGTIGGSHKAILGNCIPDKGEASANTLKWGMCQAILRNSKEKEWLEQGSEQKRVVGKDGSLKIRYQEWDGKRRESWGGFPWTL